MRKLEDMTIGHRIALTFVIVLVILFALALAGFLSGRWDQAPAQPQAQQGDLYGATPLDATLLRLDRRALEEAYHAQMLKLFGVWVSSGAPDEAKNFRNGLFIARRAYRQAAESIAKREQEVLGQEREHHDDKK